MPRVHYKYEIRNRFDELLAVASSQKDLAKKIKKYLGVGVFERVTVYKVIN